MRACATPSTAIALVCGITFSVIGPNAHGQAITQSAFNSDATCGVSAANVYTHAIDVGGGSSTVVNGVTFNPFVPISEFVSPSIAAPNFDYPAAEGQTATSSIAPWTLLPDQAIATVMDTFVYNAWAGTATLTGLTPGTEYQVRVYLRSYAAEDRLLSLAFDEDGAGPLGASTGVFNEDDATTRGFADRDQNYWIGYRYTAGPSASLTVSNQNAVGANGSYHFYAITNQVVPEPAGGVCVGICCVAQLVLRRQRNAAYSAANADC